LLGSTKNKRYEQTKTDILDGGGLKPAIKDHQQVIETLLKSDKIPANVLSARMDIMHDWLVYHAQKATLAQNLVNAHASGKQDQIELARKELTEYYDKPDQFNDTQKRAINDDGYTPAQFKNLSDQVQLESYAIRLVYKSLYEEAKAKFPEDEFPSDEYFEEKDLKDTKAITPETDTTEKVNPEIIEPTKSTTETSTEEVTSTEDSKLAEDTTVTKETIQPEQDTLQDESNILPMTDKEIQSMYDSYQEEIQNEESIIEPLTATQLQGIFNNIIGLFKANKVATLISTEIAIKILTHLFQKD